MDICVVMMHAFRPERVKALAFHYLAMAGVAQLLVADSGRSPLVLQPHDRLRTLRMSHDPGLYLRFAAAALAPADPVLLVDDDIEIPEATICELHRRWAAQPGGVHGIFGRAPGATYEPRDVHGPCEIVLTRCAMASRRLCALALANGLELLRTCPGEPRGNGEDIVLSYTALANGADANYAHRLPYANAGHNDAVSISVRNASHRAHRTAVVAWCRGRLFSENRSYAHNLRHDLPQPAV